MIESFIIVSMKMKFKNMKIEINEEQPLDAVVKELERLGFNVLPFMGGNLRNIVTKENGLAFIVRDFKIPSRYKPTTISELREMK